MRVPDDSPQPRDTAERLRREILGGTPRYTINQLAEFAGANVEEVRRYWRGVGLPDDGPDATSGTEEPARAAIRYTDDDVDAIRQWVHFVNDLGLAPDLAMTLIRSVGHTSERQSFWQIETLVDHFQRTYALDPTSARLLALDRLGEVVDALQTQLVHAWRHQLEAVATRYTHEFADIDPKDVAAPGELPLQRAVGFADVINFTSSTSQLTSEELADLVQRFEAGVRDIVSAHRGRVVKTIGDAVLFIADDAHNAADIALALADASRQAATNGGEPFPRVRVSLVWGRVLPRFGDVFGPPVNLAARLNAVANQGDVLIDESAARALEGSSRHEVTALPRRLVPGIGPVTPYVLRER